MKSRIEEALAASSWSEGVQGAVMLLYLSLKTLNNLTLLPQQVLKILDQNLFKFNERHINIINFHMNKIESIDYNLIKDYINYFIILYNEILGKRDLLMKMFSKYISIGLRINDIIYIDKYIKNIIIKLMVDEKGKVKSCLKNQSDDLRFKDLFLAIYMSKIDITNNIISIKSPNANLDKKIKDIYSKIRTSDKIIILINHFRKYF